MNRIKTFFTFIGVYLIAVIVVKLLVFFSNKVMDSTSDFLYLPTSGSAIGFFGLLIASSKAIKVSDNPERTTKIIWITYLILFSIVTLYGLFQIGIGIYLGLPLFDLEAIDPHWLYTLPLGIGGLVAVYQIKKGVVW